MDCSPPGSSVHETSQAKILEWVTISYSRGSSWPRDQTCVSCIAGGFFTAELWGQPLWRQVPVEKFCDRQVELDGDKLCTGATLQQWETRNTYLHVSEPPLPALMVSLGNSSHMLEALFFQPYPHYTSNKINSKKKIPTRSSPGSIHPIVNMSWGVHISVGFVSKSNIWTAICNTVGLVLLHISRIMQYLSFCDCFISLSLLSLSFIHVVLVACVRISRIYISLRYKSPLKMLQTCFRTLGVWVGIRSLGLAINSPPSFPITDTSSILMSLISLILLSLILMALISHASRVMLKILQARLQQYVNRELPDVQAGFRKGRGTRDQIASMHWIIQKARQFQKNIYFCLLTMPKPLTVWITINCGKF